MPYKILQLGEDIWVNELCLALGRQGHEVGLLSLKNTKSLSDILQEIDQFKPDFTLGRNYYLFTSPSYGLSLDDGLSLADELAIRNIHHLAWQLDAPLASGSTELLGLWAKEFRPKKTTFLVTDKTHLGFYADRKLSCHHLPMAAPEHYFETKFSDKEKIPLCFVGTPPPFPEFKKAPQNAEEVAPFFAIRETMDFVRTLSSMPHNPVSLDEAHQKRLFEVFLAFFGAWPGNTGHYNQQLDNLLTGIHNVTGVKGAHSGFLDLRFSNAQLMRSILSLQHQSLRIFGGENWQQWLGGNPTDYPRLDFYSEVPQVFHDATITFCLTKWQYRTAVHDRPLSVLACGGFPLTDFREELDQTFQPGEIVSYQSLQEAKDLIQYYTINESERLSVIQKGRERVKKDHTYANRAQEVTKLLGSLR